MSEAAYHGVQIRISLRSSLVVLVRSVLLSLREALVEEALAVRCPSDTAELDKAENVFLKTALVFADFLVGQVRGGSGANVEGGPVGAL
jgi:hypothetical protein